LGHSVDGLHFCRRPPTSLTQLAPRAVEFGRIAQNKGHNTVQGLSGSRFWYQSTCHATSYQWLILTYIISRTILKLLVIGQICAFYRGSHCSGWTPKLSRDYEIWPQETRNIALSYGLNIFRYLEFGVADERDRQTDGHTEPVKAGLTTHAKK